ncbi:haloacid dehalogenase [Thiocapsa imhoffii]|uniref:Haloacid dehalogenase n=1 Tax=Thiocapsa imhoffii TaxID=382777 RepID=A0A9X0WGC8_9GAMM|nr:HAD family hydrolase [Thiocapsa imhoffii]MBK1643794.1 haloacid dehalogenase [Thiocapsa imhoffii]
MTTAAIRVITLDLDDTLWPCAPVIEAAEEAFYDWLCRHTPRLATVHDLDSLRRHRRALMTDQPEIAHDLGQVRRRSLATLMASFDYSVELAEEAMALFDVHRNRVEPFDDVLPVLRGWSTRFRLIALTNGTANPEATPLRGLFERRLTAAEAGAAKPHPALFQCALAHAGCTPSECLHVGDDPWMDIEAARALGVKAVWVNRDERPWPSELAPPVLTVRDLHQLDDWLGGGGEPAW